MSNEISPLIDRMYLFLEEKNWNKANEYCERILDIEPKNVDAYIGKLMIDLRINIIENLTNCKKNFENNLNYKRIILYGNDSVKLQFQNYLSSIKTEIMRENKQRKDHFNRIKKPLFIISLFAFALVIVVNCLFFYFPKQKKEETIINKDKNYIVYNGMNIKLPYGENCSVKVENNTIILKGFDITINKFLSYVYPASGKEFGTTNSFASSNGNSSFIIKDYTTLRTQYYYNGDWHSETLDLIFCAYGKNYTAKYINKSGNVPLRYAGAGNSLSITAENEWKTDIHFESNKETVLFGQYTDSTSIVIKVKKT